MTGVLLTDSEIEEAVGRGILPSVVDGVEYRGLGYHNCHVASYLIVESGVLGTPCRVARGSCRGVLGQHSWVVIGMDCYDSTAQILDPTLWSYDEKVSGFWWGKNLVRHRPHGLGHIFEAPKPKSFGGPTIELPGEIQLSQRARSFLTALGPLDIRGWQMLLNGPVQGWESAEIINAAWQVPGLKALIPIDYVGMLTDQNPLGCYIRKADDDVHG